MSAPAAVATATVDILVPLLQNYLEAADRDRDAQKEVVKELKQTLESIRECSVTMKLQIKAIETHYQDFDQHCVARKIDCLGKFSQIDEQFKSVTQQLSALPSAKELEKRERKLDTLIEKVNSLIIRVYIIIGTTTAMFGFIKFAWPIITK